MSGAFPATCIVHTPRGPSAMCDRHAAMAEAIFGAIDCHINRTVAPEGAQCANCENAPWAKGGAS